MNYDFLLIHFHEYVRKMHEYFQKNLSVHFIRNLSLTYSPYIKKTMFFTVELKRLWAFQTFNKERALWCVSRTVKDQKFKTSALLSHTLHSSFWGWEKGQMCSKGSSAAFCAPCCSDCADPWVERCGRLPGRPTLSAGFK